MNILIATNLWSGMVKFFSEGKDETSGTPNLYYALKKLNYDEEINDIILFLFINKKYGIKTIKVPRKYNKIKKIFAVTYRNKIDFLLKIPFLIWMEQRAIKQYKIDIIYEHGSFGTLSSSILKKIFKIPVVRRLYGTFLGEHVQSGRLLMFLKYPFDYIAFHLPVDFLVVTNDGTKGDEVFKKIGYKKATLIFLLNGVRKKRIRFRKPRFKLPQIYFTYIGRIARWKRQEIGIQLISLLKESGVSIPLLIVGGITDPDYFYYLKGLAKQTKVEDLIYFVGELAAEEVYYIQEKAMLTFLFYDLTNLSNVLLESLCIGVPILSHNINGSLDKFPNDIMIKFNNINYERILLKIKDLLYRKDKLRKISFEAKKFCEEYIMDWETRLNFEINIIKKANKKLIG